MGHSTSSGRSQSGASQASLVDSYLSRASRLHSMSELNELIEAAANDDGLRNQEYERIYSEIVRRIQRGEY